MNTAVRSAVVFLLVTAGALQAQKKTAPQIVQSAVDTELQADRDDHTAWVYRDHDVTPDHDTLYLVAECPQGAARRKLEDHGHPLTAAQEKQETARIQAFVTDAGRLQKQKRDAKHDDDQAESMLRLLPRAFIWTIKSDEGDLLTLAFQPNPGFAAQSMEARVLSAMAGEIVVFRPQNRIQSIRGTLVNDVTFGFGMLGRLHKGGGFQVERREIAPLHWQITSSRVHIEGRALLFKTIGEQEDESKTDFRLSTAQTIAEAAAEVNEGR